MPPPLTAHRSTSTAPRTISSRFRAADAAFASYPHALHYALKANSTLAIVRLLRSLGSKVDANSGGEIDVALRAGFIPPEIVFTGVGKTAAELTQAIDLGVKTINAESEGELERIDAIARARQARARVAIRVNPDIDARSHPHISTGLKTNKFGVSIAEARDLCRRMRDRPGLEIVGLHTHVGSQIMDLEPLRRAAAAVVELARDLRADGLAIEHLDLGGGLGISYDGTVAPTAEEYAAAVLPVVRDSGLAIVLEPGRSIVGPAGALLTRVVDVKEQPGGKLFVILDAGMTELMRPMLYNAYHRIEPVESREGPDVLSDVVGPLCETQRHARQGSAVSASGGRRPLCRARRRRVWRRHGVELQPAHAAGRSHGAGWPDERHPPAPDDRRHPGARDVGTVLCEIASR